MKTPQALILGAVIAMAGVSLYYVMDEKSAGEEIRDSYNEGVEEVKDEIDDAR